MTTFYVKHRGVCLFLKYFLCMCLSHGQRVLNSISWTGVLWLRNRGLYENSRKEKEEREEGRREGKREGRRKEGGKKRGRNFIMTRRLASSLELSWISHYWKICLFPSCFLPKLRWLATLTGGRPALGPSPSISEWWCQVSDGAASSAMM